MSIIYSELQFWLLCNLVRILECATDAASRVGRKVKAFSPECTRYAVLRFWDYYHSSSTTNSEAVSLQTVADGDSSLSTF